MLFDTCALLFDTCALLFDTCVVLFDTCAMPCLRWLVWVIESSLVGKLVGWLGKSPAGLQAP
jgi:hypothetical protein